MTANLAELHDPPSTERQTRISGAVATLLFSLAVFVVLVSQSCGGRSARPMPGSTTPEPSVETPAEPAPVPPVPAPELDVVIAPSAIRKGESALLKWEARNADRVRINHNIGVVETSGRIKFFPDETTTYQLLAEGPGGQTTRTITVDVLMDELRIAEEDLGDRPLAEQFSYFVKPIFFEYDSAELSAEARSALDANILWLTRPENSGVEFLVEGHCDERGTDEYNLALGDRRTQSVLSYMLRHGVQASRMTTVTLGEERPFDPRSTEEAWALNRRAHFVMAGAAR